jgi:uncharacterized protein YdiU (UPF0061 family)
MTHCSGKSRSDAGWKFENSYAQLPEDFFVRLNPVPVRTPKLVVFNVALAQYLGLNPDSLKGDEGAAVFRATGFPRGPNPLLRPMRGINSAISPCWAMGGQYYWASK